MNNIKVVETNRILDIVGIPPKRVLSGYCTGIFDISTELVQSCIGSNPIYTSLPSMMPNGRANSIEDWLNKIGVIVSRNKEDNTLYKSEKQIAEEDNNRDKVVKKISSCLQSQLGAEWNGINNEPEVRRLLLRLLSMYILKHNPVEINDKINTVLQEISTVKSITEINQEGLFGAEIIKEADQTIENIHTGYTLGNSVIHKWSNTVAWAVVDAAKKSNGVIVNSYFIWARLLDPIMWSVINSYGRKEPFVDVLGIYQHAFNENVYREQNFYKSNKDSFNVKVDVDMSSPARSLIEENCTYMFA